MLLLATNALAALVMTSAINWTAVQIFMMVTTRQDKECGINQDVERW